MVVTKTLGPLHFEDLEPHRFEDLVRKLVYDIRDWQSIEATGRGGSERGSTSARMSARAPPKATRMNRSPRKTMRPLIPWRGASGCSNVSARRKSAPARIIDDRVKAGNPPYGHVLAAPASFSKKSFDVFRKELRKRGVMEFSLWGRPALEDMPLFSSA